MYNSLFIPYHLWSFFLYLLSNLFSPQQKLLSLHCSNINMNDAETSERERMQYNLSICPSLLCLLSLKTTMRSKKVLQTDTIREPVESQMFILFFFRKASTGAVEKSSIYCNLSSIDLICDIKNHVYRETIRL